MAQAPQVKNKTKKPSNKNFNPAAIKMAAK